MDEAPRALLEAFSPTPPDGGVRRLSELLPLLRFLERVPVHFVLRLGEASLNAMAATFSTGSYGALTKAELKRAVALGVQRAMARLMRQNPGARIGVNDLSTLTKAGMDAAGDALVAAKPDIRQGPTGAGTATMRS